VKVIYLAGRTVGVGFETVVQALDVDTLQSGGVAHITAQGVSIWQTKMAKIGHTAPLTGFILSSSK
jgi:hypothetical protein